MSASEPSWNDLIALSLTDAGVLGQGQTASAFDIVNGLTRLNWMISQWRKQRWLVYTLRTDGLVQTGAQTYTVGPGGDYDMVARPDRLEAAFFRQLIQSQPSQIDYPLEVLQAREDYNMIALKQLTEFPQYVYYDPTWPLGTLYPWPIPQADIYSVFITSKIILDKVTEDNLATPILLPEEYFMAVHLSLAEVLRMAYKLPVDLDLKGMAEGARCILRASNTQIPRLQIPAEVVRPGIYNVFSDQIR